MVSLKYSQIKGISSSDIASLHSALAVADRKLKDKSGEGNDYVGWLDQPVNYDKEEFARIKVAAEKIRQNSDVLLVVGIGGSYLGARAVIEFLHGSYYNRAHKPEIYFVGNSFSSEELEEVLSFCEGKRVAVNVISKSGTTTECAVAFRIIRNYMESRYTKDELKDRIFATTDKSKGALRALATANGYETFVVPDDIGGRFSVLTAVGLLPIAVSGADIDALMQGAYDERAKLLSEGMTNDAYTYAVLRNAYLAKGRTTEVMVSYDPCFRFMGEWWKQLFGESEGKDKKGLFPASVTFSTDLHSLGQFIQDGSPVLFETICRNTKPSTKMTVPFDNDNSDGLGYLAGSSLAAISDKALTGTLLAHRDGGTDSLVIDYDGRNEHTLGELIYFFFIACGASAYILGVNPFNQPGVEAYKKNMFALLGKPGYEELRNQLMSQKLDFNA